MDSEILSHKKICIIPARAGSKRVPKKNIKLFLGKPIIAYSIRAAIDSNLFDEIMVSTDDVEIAEIAKQYGAKVPFLRSAKNANDFATTFDVLEEVITEYKKTGKYFKYTCCLYSTAPFVTSSQLGNAYQSMIENNYKSIFPIIEYSYPIQRSLRINEGTLEYVDANNKNSRSQDLEKSYHDAGQFYFMKTKVINNKETLVGNNAGSILISELEAQDIDSLTDWAMAELKLGLLNR